MKVGQLVGAVVLVGLGAVGGYLLVPGGGEPAAGGETSAYVPKKALADDGDKASLKALRARVRELEKLLAAKDAEVAAATTAVATAERPPADPWGDGRREGFRERMERLKTEDPARYTEITNNMARWRQRRARQQEERMEFLASVDTSRMSVAAKGVHASLQKYAAEREELERQMQNENLSDDDRHALWEQMHEVNRQVWALNGVERKNLIEETARNLGFEGQDVQDISATMQEIIKATDNGFGGHGGHGGPGRGRHGRGGPPPR